MKTIKPTRSPFGSPPEMTRTFSSFGRQSEISEQNVDQGCPEDYSDLAPSDEMEFDQKLAKFKISGLQANKIYRPEDISMLSLRGTPGPSRPSSARGLSNDLPKRPRLGSSSSFGSGSSRSPSRAPSFRLTSMEDVEHLRATERELRKYAEEDEEDYDDVFTGGMPSHQKPRKHEKRPSTLVTSLSLCRPHSRCHACP